MKDKNTDTKKLEKSMFITESMNDYIARISTGKKTISHEDYMNLRD